MSVNSLFSIVIILILWLGFLHVQFWLLQKRLKILFNGRKAADLEEIMAEQIKRLRKNEENFKELVKIAEQLEKMASHSIQKVGLVRFNPFKDTGGNQSFSLALLDSFNNGLVITSLFNREENHIFAKPVSQKKSSYPLSAEEKEAIEKAD